GTSASSSNGNAYNRANVATLPTMLTFSVPYPRRASTGTVSASITSRATITSTSHSGTTSRHARPISVTKMNNRSASGSSICPSRVTWFNRRASTPSNQSVAPDTASTSRANPSSPTTTNQAKTGTSARRTRPLTLGTVSPRELSSAPVDTHTALVHAGSSSAAILRAPPCGYAPARRPPDDPQTPPTSPACRTSPPHPCAEPPRTR